jgi:hypothetical protein
MFSGLGTMEKSSLEADINCGDQERHQQAGSRLPQQPGSLS